MPSWVLAVEVDFRSGYGDKGGACQERMEGDERVGKGEGENGQLIKS